MSTHTVQIVEVPNPEVHSNADALELVRFGGWQCVVRKGDFKAGDRAVFIEPDYMVPTTRPEFAFLDKKKTGKPYRLKAVRLRGELSFGLLIHVPAQLSDRAVGDNVMEDLEITRYEPPVSTRWKLGGESQQAPRLFVPKFDLENWQRYPDFIPEGTIVAITEKLHGCNARFVFHEDKVYCGSRNLWPVDAPGNLWWEMLRACPAIETYIRANPDQVVFGEIYGDVQDLKYGHKPGELSFAAFALLDAKNGKWIDYADMAHRFNIAGIPLAPLVFVGPFHPSHLAMAEEDSIAASQREVAQLSEGIVIVPVNERHGPSAGRMALKMVSNRYLTA